jgi:hypothetical protein
MNKVHRVSHGRTKLRYSPTPTPGEKAHHIRVMELGCMICGCTAIAHHVLQRSPHKRWRRDHHFVVPLCAPHHAELHGMGDEALFEGKYGLDICNTARILELESIMEGLI